MKIEELVLLPVRTFRTQATDPATVAEYAALMAAGTTFPPLTVAEVGKSKTQVLIGGAHRLAAAVKAGLKDIEVTTVACKSAADAEVATFADNASHGLSLTPEDKRKAILTIIQLKPFAKLSNAAIAKRLGVSDMTVKRYRDAVGTVSPKAKMSGHKSKIEPKVDKGGKVQAQTSDPVAWKIAGAKMGGGADKVAAAIVAKITEGVSTKQADTWRERVQYVYEVCEALERWISAQSV
ncbi:MAG TPA: ParB N-terminal domain-containing protein [Anaerolineae bacterium]|nr:ParB N-terminal domain-containing protein [Anaerolineae bacterium]